MLALVRVLDLLFVKMKRKKRKRAKDEKLEIEKPRQEAENNDR